MLRVLTVIALMMFGCAGHRAVNTAAEPGQHARAVIDPPEATVFRVLAHSSEPHGGIDAATVVAVSEDGSLVVLGSTVRGVIDVPKDTLRSLNPSFLIICGERYFCGAIEMTSEKLERLHETHIELARWTIH